MYRDITMKQLQIVTAVCAFSFSIAQVNAQDQFLVDKGKAYAEIIISESPAWLAAAELQTYIAKISDQRLPGSESGHFFSKQESFLRQPILGRRGNIRVTLTCLTIWQHVLSVMDGIRKN